MSLHPTSQGRTSSPRETEGLVYKFSEKTTTGNAGHAEDAREVSGERMKGGFLFSVFDTLTSGD